MKPRIVPFLALVAASILLIAGCSQAAPAAAPTQAPAAKAAPTSAPAAPTKAAAAPTTAPQPTAAPKVDFPQKNRPITLIIPWPAGGPVDTAVRVLAAAMEKQLGAPVTLVNKGGASSQVGLTELMKAKPDGYTIGQFQLPTGAATYLDKSTGAVYAKKDFMTVAQYGVDATALGVKADSPYKNLKDIVAFAKAHPKEFKIGTAGLGGVTHYAGLLLAQKAGVEFNFVHFAGGAPAITATLGGSVDGVITGASALVPQSGSGGTMMIAGIFSAEPVTALTGVETAKQQGFDATIGTSSGILAPAGTPKEIVAILSDAVKKSLDDPQVVDRYKALSYNRAYLDPAAYDKVWTDQEAIVKALIPLVKQGAQ